MSSNRRGNVLRLVVPTEETINRADVSLLEFIDYGVDLKDLLRISFETWVDINGYRRRNGIYHFPFYTTNDPVDALQTRIGDDILEPMLDSDIKERYLTELGNGMTELCLLSYLDFEKYLSFNKLPIPTGACIEEECWLNMDLVVRVENF